MAIRLYETPFSTNVERVTLAAGVKGINLEHVQVDAGDRGAVREISGQDLVPVIESEGDVIADAMAILAYLDRFEPSLHASRPPVTIFCDWFNQVWKVAPNTIADTGDTHPWAAEMEAHLELFEGLLGEHEYLLGPELTCADLVAFPFLKYAVRREPTDDEPFHMVLDEHQSVEGRPHLAAWIDNINSLPRA